MRFNYRVAGVVYDGDKVLIHRSEIDDFWSMPGGRCEFLESAADALVREMREELGVEVNVVRLLWFVEDFFEHLGTQFHELALYFLMTFSDDCPLYGMTEAFLGVEEGMKLFF